MGGIGKALGKVMDVVKPFVSMVNPLLGAAMGFASGLMQGKNPLQALLGAATDLIPGGGGLGGIFKNVLGNVGGQAGKWLMDSFGGNGLVGSALNLVGSKSGVTDILGGVAKQAMGFGGLTDQGQNNLAELAAQRMSRFFLE